MIQFFIFALGALFGFMVASVLYATDDEWEDVDD